MGRSAVKVVVRTRPTERLASQIKLGEDGRALHLYMQKKKDSGVVNNTQENFSYKVDQILHNSSQEATYDAVAHEAVQSSLQGYNATVMAYGQTGAGKTYTMTGGNDFKTRGIISRAISDIFNEIAQQPDKTFQVSVSYMEIYNERLYDLLDPTTEDLLIQEDSKGCITVRGLTQRPVTTEAEALAHMFDGNANRAMADHALNANSSRSHTVFTIHIHSRSRVESDGHALSSKLHLIDLAGSERVAKTGSEGTTLREATYINKSLSFLEQVVIALSSQARSHIPFRQCRLTNLLKDSLGGNCKTVMVGNIWPEERHLEETVSTLKFATRMMRIQNDPTVNIVIDPSAQIKMLQKQIIELKAELQMQNQLHGKSHIKYDTFTDDEKFELEKKVQAYLSGAVDDIEVKSLREVKEYFKLFKACIDRVATETEERLKARFNMSEKPKQEGAGGTGAPTDLQGDDGVGELDAASGFGIGTAAPAKGIRQAMGKGAHEASPRRESQAVVNSESQPTAEPAMKVTLPDRNHAYEDFKANEGSELAALLKQNLADLKERKKQIIELSHAVNEIKAEVEHVKNSQKQRQHDPEEEDVLDEEEVSALKELKKLKQRYRTTFEELQQARAHKEYTQRMVDQARQKLLMDFETWYAKTYPSEGTPQANGAVANPEGDRLDEGERFEKMEEARLLEEDPEALEYYRAQKMATFRTGGRGRGAGWSAAKSNKMRL